MATFTVRFPDSMAGRLGSAEVRAWLGDFLRAPRQLPPDPGSGDFRISLALPEELVRSLSACLRCSPSIALRRLAAWRLGLWQESGQTPHDRNSGVGNSRLASGSSSVGDFTPYEESPRQPINGMVLLIEICVILVVIGVMIFSQSRDANS